MDKMQVYNHDGTDYRECISCGFKDQIRIASAPNELQTRVNKSAVNEETRQVKLVDPPKTN